MNDPLNRFEKMRKPTAEDCQTKWSRNNEARAADTTERDARVDRNARQRASWSGDHRSGGVRTTSGVALDPQTARLKSAAEAERRQAPSAAPYVPTAEDIVAFTFRFLGKHPEYVETALNGANMASYILEHVAKGTLRWGVEAFEEAYTHLDIHGFIEDQQPSIPRKRGYATRPAPKNYPRFLNDEARATAEDRQKAEAARQAARAVERALSLDFGTLQREVRSRLPRYGSEVL